MIIILKFLSILYIHYLFLYKIIINNQVGTYTLWIVNILQPSNAVLLFSALH